MHVQLTPSDAVVVGGELHVSCDIWNWQPERSMFVVWLRRSHGSEVELGTNEKVVDQLRDRYSARKELRRPADFTRVSYYLTITGTTCRAHIVQYIRSNKENGLKRRCLRCAMRCVVSESTRWNYPGLAATPPRRIAQRSTCGSDA